MSRDNGDGTARDRDPRPAPIESPFGQDYARQRERRAAALAGALSSDAKRADSGVSVPADGNGSIDREQWWRDLARPGLPASSPGLDLLVLLSQFPLAMSLSGFRQWHKQMQLAADYGGALLNLLGSSNFAASAAQAERNRVVEETRAYLRRVSNLSLQEARLLQLELERIGDALREAVADQRPDGGGSARRWRAKP